jgi:hypothetical protein
MQARREDPFGLVGLAHVFSDDNVAFMTGVSLLDQMAWRMPVFADDDTMADR